MKTENPMSLSQIQMRAYGSEDAVAKRFPAVDLFDERIDFAVDMCQSAMAVLMTFTNERRLLSAEASGIRRKASVSLVDETADCVEGTAIVNVTIPKGNLVGMVRADIPFEYTDIKPSHLYKIVVRDELSGKFLGERRFQMYDIISLGLNPSQWYEAVRGGLVKEDEYSFEFLRSEEADDMTYHYVRFDVELQFLEKPRILPELQVKVYFPDGTIASRFLFPELDEMDYYEHYVQMPFLVSASKMGVCYAELLCMDYVIAGFAFSTAGPNVQGTYEGRELECIDSYSLSGAEKRWLKSLPEYSETSETEELSAEAIAFEEGLQRFIESDEKPAGKDEEPVQDTSVMDELDSLVGLQSVKRKLHVYESLVAFNARRIASGLPYPSVPLHAMFLGSPGTGKTTVAKMMGRMLKEAGVLETGHVVARERSTLLGPYYSTEETNTLKAIEEARGGILFIDEAYQLYQPNDPRDPGKFVIEALMTALADESKRDWMLILAGYPEPMKQMFEMNPGLKSRIPESNIYVFEDFTEHELMQIADQYFESHSFNLSPEARDALCERLSRDYSQRDETFGNARHVLNLIQTDIIPAMALRVMSENSADIQALTTIQAGDIPQGHSFSFSPDGRRRVGFRA